MERAGFTPMVAAEIHYNIHLQLALIQSGYGVGLLPARFIARNNSLDTVEVLRPPSFDLHMSVAIVRVGQLGALERAVELLEHGIRHLFEAADTTKPVTRSRRSVPAPSRHYLMAVASISIRQSFGNRAASSVVGAGRFPLKNLAYTSFIAEKSFMVLSRTTQRTTLFMLEPAA